MCCRRRLTSFVGLVGTLALSTAPACAQLNKQDKERISITLGTEIARQIDRHPKEGTGLREKLIGRLVQCGVIFAVISKQANDTGTRNQLSDVADISFELSARVSNGMTLDRFKSIADPAEKDMKQRLSFPRTSETEQEMNILLKNCKMFHRIEEISGAVAAFLPVAPQPADAVPVEFGKELQECALYYFLAAGELLDQVPKNSGPLSPADSDKAVKSMVYITKSEQIDVLWKRVAQLTGKSDEFAKRHEVMFNEEKRVMGASFQIGILHERYKDFCEYILSDSGRKASRLKEISQGNVCGRLYTCW